MQCQTTQPSILFDIAQSSSFMFYSSLFFGISVAAHFSTDDNANTGCI